MKWAATLGASLALTGGLVAAAPRLVPIRARIPGTATAVTVRARQSAGGQFLVGSAGALAHNDSAGARPRLLRGRHLRHLLPVPEGLDDVSRELATQLHDNAIRRLQETWSPAKLAKMLAGRDVYRLPADGPGLVIRDDAVFINPVRLGADNAAEIAAALQTADLDSALRALDATDQTLEALSGQRAFHQIDADELELMRASNQTEWVALESEVHPRGRRSAREPTELSMGELEAQHLGVPAVLRKIREAEQLLQQPARLNKLSVDELDELAFDVVEAERYTSALDLEDRLRADWVNRQLVRRIDALEAGDSGIVFKSDPPVDAPDFSPVPSATDRFDALLRESRDLVARRRLEELPTPWVIGLERQLRGFGMAADLGGMGRNELRAYVDVLEAVHRGRHLDEMSTAALHQVDEFVGKVTTQLRSGAGEPWVLGPRLQVLQDAVGRSLRRRRE